MTARLCKEPRPLMPLLLFGAPILAACAMLDNGACLWLATTIYCLLCAVVGIGAMGFEMVHGMQANLFAQPIPREATWRDKLLVQAGALLLLGAVYAWVVATIDRLPYSDYGNKGVLTLAAIAPLAAIGGGSLLVLALRHVQAAFLMLIAVAVAFHFVIEALWPIKLLEWQVLAHVTGFVLMAGAGIWLGRKQFVGFQSYSLLQNALSLGHDKKDVAVSHSGITSTLLWKEYRLHWVNLAILGVAFVLSLPLGEIYGTSGWALIKDLVCLLLPCFVGAAAVSEERRMGVDRWHLTMPPHHGRQWRLKVRAAYTLALSGIVLYALSRWIAPKLSQEGMLGSIEIDAYLYYNLMATALGLFVSSLCRHFIQAAAITCVMMAALVILFFSGVDWIIGSYSFVWPHRLALVIGLPAMIACALWRGGRNFGSTISIGRSMHDLIVCISAVLVVTAVIYHRTWELFGRSQVGAATVKLSDVSQLFSIFDRRVAVDANGRLLAVTWEPKVTKTRKKHNMGWNYAYRTNAPAVPVFTQIGQEKWERIVPRSQYRHAALRQDGTLWEFPDVNTNRFEMPDLRGAEMREMTPGFRWKSVAIRGLYHVGVRDDGTLWRWGHNKQGHFGIEDKELVWPEPRRLGRDDDWKQVMSGLRSIGIKEDGSVWYWGRITEIKDGIAYPIVTYIPEPRRLERLKSFRVRQARQYHNGWYFELTDGRWLIYHPWEFWPFAKELPGHPKLRLLDERIDVDGIAQNSWRPLLATDRDGVLWQCSEDDRNPFRRRVRAVDGDDSWLIATEMSDDEWIGVKHDGSVWYWNFLNRYVDGRERDYGKNYAWDWDDFIPERFRPIKIGMLDESLLPPRKETP